MNPILNILQLSDSMFPIGSFAHSFGLETLISDGRVTKDNFKEYLGSMLKNQVGPCDMVFMLAANKNLNQAEELSKRYACYKVVPPFYKASLTMGKRLLSVGEKLTGNTYLKSLNEKQILHPIAFGTVTNVMDIPASYASNAFLYNWAASTTSAAIRLIPLGHDSAQKILHEIKETISEVYEKNKDKSIEDAWQFTPETEIAGLEHEKLYTKLFLS